MMAVGFTPFTKAKGKGMGPLPATSHGSDKASTRVAAVSCPEPINVSADEILFNTEPGSSNMSQRDPPARAKNAPDSHAAVLLRVIRYASKPARTVASANTNPRARSSDVQGVAFATRMN